MDKVLESAIDLLVLYDQRLGAMTIKEHRERFGFYAGWQVLSRSKIEEIVTLMEEDGFRLVVQQRYDD